MLLPAIPYAIVIGLGFVAGRPGVLATDELKRSHSWTAGSGVAREPVAKAAIPSPLPEPTSQNAGAVA